MLNERPLRALRYDAATDEACLDVGEPGEAPPTGRPRALLGQLLLDAQGFLVGVDLGGEGLSRAIVMLGPHENVERTVGVELVVRGDASVGSSGAFEVRIAGAKEALRADEKNPYV